MNSRIVPNPNIGLTATDAAVLVLSGNPKLAPETANTTTAGFVLSPGGWAEGMHFSADWYKIKLDGGQALEMAQNVVNQCYDGSDPSKCAQIIFGAPIPGQGAQSNITQVRARLHQPVAVRDSGRRHQLGLPHADGEAVQRREGQPVVPSRGHVLAEDADRDEWHAEGYLGPDRRRPGVPLDFAAAPNFAGNLTMSYLNDPLTVTLQTRWVSAGRLDKQNPKIGAERCGLQPESHLQRFG